MQTPRYHRSPLPGLLTMLIAVLIALPDGAQAQNATDPVDAFRNTNVRTGFALRDFTASLKSLTSSFDCPSGVIPGTMEPSSPTQFGRIFRDGIPSTCGGKAYPGIFNIGTPYNYEVFGPYGNTGTGTCATVNFDVGTCGTNAHANAYVNGYDPNNQGLNFLGDVGSSVTQPFSFPIPDGLDYYIVVTTTASTVNTACDFSFEIVDVPCSSGTDLALTKTVQTHNDQTGTYYLTVINNGPEDDTGVQVTDYLPNYLTVTGAVATLGTFDANTGLWDIGDLANGAVAELWINVTFEASGIYTNSAEITATDLDDTDTSNNFGEVSVLVLEGRVVPDFVPEAGPGGVINRGHRFVADLALEKTVDNDAPAAADTVTYTLTLSNGGPQSTANVEVTDLLPACLTFVSATASRGTYDEASGLWDVGNVKLGESLTLEIVTVVGSACTGTVTNTASITGSSLPDPTDLFNLFDDPPEENDVSEASFTVSASQARMLDGRDIVLGMNYPNPFNPTTTVPFSVVEASRVKLAVYDLLGREVAVLVDGTVSAGVHAVVFEASQLPTGVYLVRLEASGVVQTQRITLMK